MNFFIDYIKKCILRVENTPIEQMQKFVTDVPNARALHAAIGISTEAGELLDGFKKALVYGGREIDKVNIGEEIGDLMWYVGLLCDAYGYDLKRCVEVNEAKLRTRYAHKFTDGEAHERDLFQERSVLESGFSEGDKNVSSK